MKWLKKTLEFALHSILPVEKNRNVPHLLRHTPVAFMFVGAVGLFLFSNHNFTLIKRLNLTAAVYPSVLIDLTNKDRNVEGLKPLAWNDKLAQAAKLKAEDMFAHGYFAHTSPQGITPWYWLTQIKYNFTYAGENLAIRFDDSENVQDAWLDSPTHRANIMNTKFTEIGIAAVDGIFEGKETTVVVEFFGSPAFASFSTTPPPPVAVATTPPAATTPNLNVAGAEEEKKPTTPKPRVAPTPPPQVPPEVTTTPNVETVEEGKTFVVVKNIDEHSEATVSPTSGTSYWYERFVVSPTDTVRSLYALMILALVTSMGLMLFKQYEKHHLKHFTMGFSLLVVVVLLWYFTAPGLYLV